MNCGIIVIGCVYKHPFMGIDLFNNQYLSPVLKSVEKEGKSLTLLGDFDINLLTCDSKASHANFLDTKCCHQLLFQPESQIPQALLLTTSLFIRLILTFYLAILQFLSLSIFLNLFSLVSNLRLVLNHPWDFVVTGQNSIANNSKTNLKT